MNTSFSKYVKQCKWGLSLDTAGSDYSAHNNLGASARTQCSALGGERFPGAEQPHSGSQHLRWRRLAGKCRGVGGGGGGERRAGPLDPLLPTQGGHPRGAGRSWPRRGRGSSTPAPLGLGTPVKG